MEYMTFIAQPHTWKLYLGIGTEGEILAEITSLGTVLGLSAALPPFLWIGTQRDATQEIVIQRLTLPALEVERIPWNKGRVGTLASTVDAQKVMILTLPAYVNDLTQLWLWRDQSWNAIDTPLIPDISSKLVWLDDSRIVYESSERLLTILDIYTGDVEVGPSGFYPVAAHDVSNWYAIQAGSVVRFLFNQSFNQAPEVLQDFQFNNVAMLQVTRDAQVFVWSEPRLGSRSRGYIQQMGKPKQRFQEIDDGRAVGAVLGPYISL